MKLEKVTDAVLSGGAGAEKRWYDDACGTAMAMELVGERWTILIVRELMYGARRFGELKAALSGISANVLTQRLEGLIGAGIARRRQLPPPANAQVYELTEWGYEAEPAIQALGRWAARSPEHDPTLPLSAASVMMSMRTMIDPAPAGEMALTLQFRFGREAFVARVERGGLPVERGGLPVERGGLPVERGGLPVERGEVASADVTFDTDPVTLASVLYGKRPIVDAEAAGTLRLAGDRDKAQAYVDLFHLPPKAAVE